MLAGKNNAQKKQEVEKMLLAGAYTRPLSGST